MSPFPSPDNGVGIDCSASKSGLPQWRHRCAIWDWRQRQAIGRLRNRRVQCREQGARLHLGFARFQRSSVCAREVERPIGVEPGLEFVERLPARRRLSAATALNTGRAAHGGKQGDCLAGRLRASRINRVFAAVQRALRCDACLPGLSVSAASCRAPAGRKTRRLLPPVVLLLPARPPRRRRDLRPLRSR